MKKKIWILLAILVVLGGIHFMGNCLAKNAAISVQDFSVATYGNTITLQLHVDAPLSYIRAIATQQQESNVLCLESYAAFGGLHGIMGAKNVFTFPLDEEITVIALSHGENSYEEVLQKDANGGWQRVGQK